MMRLESVGGWVGGWVVESEYKRKHVLTGRINGVAATSVVNRRLANINPPQQMAAGFPFPPPSPLSPAAVSATKMSIAELLGDCGLCGCAACGLARSAIGLAVAQMMAVGTRFRAPSQQERDDAHMQWPPPLDTGTNGWGDDGIVSHTQMQMWAIDEDEKEPEVVHFLATVRSFTRHKGRCTFLRETQSDTTRTAFNGTENSPLFVSAFGAATAFLEVPNLAATGASLLVNNFAANFALGCEALNEAIVIMHGFAADDNPRLVRFSSGCSTGRNTVRNFVHDFVDAAWDDLLDVVDIKGAGMHAYRAYYLARVRARWFAHCFAHRRECIRAFEEAAALSSPEVVHRAINFVHSLGNNVRPAYEDTTEAIFGNIDRIGAAVVVARHILRLFLPSLDPPSAAEKEGATTPKKIVALFPTYKTMRGAVREGYCDDDGNAALRALDLVFPTRRLQASVPMLDEVIQSHALVAVGHDISSMDDEELRKYAASIEGGAQPPKATTSKRKRGRGRSQRIKVALEDAKAEEESKAEGTDTASTLSTSPPSSLMMMAPSSESEDLPALEMETSREEEEDGSLFAGVLGARPPGVQLFRVPSQRTSQSQEPDLVYDLWNSPRGFVFPMGLGHPEGGGQ